MNWQKVGAVAGVASAVVAVVGLIVALLTWLEPLSPSGAPGTTTANTTTSMAEGASTTTTSKTSPTPAGFVEAYRDKELLLPVGSLGVRAWVDLDRPSVRTYGSPAPDELEKPSEFTYDDDGRFSTVFSSNDVKVGFADAGVTTPEQCRDAASERPISQDEPAGQDTNIEVGTRLCVLTNQSAIALLEVTKLGPKELFGGSVTLRATLWKRA
jgi:hypothetical protein